MVKAAIWTVVEHMYERKISLLYAGPITSASEVSSSCVFVADMLHAYGATVQLCLCRVAKGTYRYPLHADPFIHEGCRPV